MPYNYDIYVEFESGSIEYFEANNYEDSENWFIIICGDKPRDHDVWIPIKAIKKLKVTRMVDKS
jgi:hypothetical protein